MGVNKNIQHNMKNILNIILVLQVTWTNAQVREDIQDIVREMVAVEMSETNAKIVTLEQEVKNMKSKHDLQEREVKIRDDKIKDMTDTFGKELKTKDDFINKLVREKDPPPPYAFFCGYLSGTSQSYGTITYSSLLYNSTNLPDDAPLNIETGIFTSGWAGTYTVTWSLFTENSGHAVLIYLRKNGETIPESLHNSRYTGLSGYIRDQGGRTLLLHLERGDTLYLYCDSCFEGVSHVTFCVTMSSFDFQ